MLGLATEIGNFMWNYVGKYNYKTKADLITETTKALYNREESKGIIIILKDIAEWDDYDVNAIIAARLLRKVREIWR